MLTVSETAQEQVKAYFEGKDVMPIRVFLHQGGCGGPQVAMALDDKKETDMVYTFDGVDYLVNSAFLEEAKPINVDFIDSGFKVTTSLSLGDGCSSCGTEGSCCS